MLWWILLALSCGPSLEEQCLEGSQSLRAELDDAASCEQDSDCAALASSCLLGCDNVLNPALAADDLQDRIDALSARCFPDCTLDCTAPDQIGCNDEGRCEGVSETR